MWGQVSNYFSLFFVPSDLSHSFEIQSFFHHAECDNQYDTRYKPERLLIFDRHPGGIGLCQAVRI
jgi:hypothetical protein